MVQETHLKKRYSLVTILLLFILVLAVAGTFFYFKYFKMASSKPDDASLYIVKVNGVGLSREAFDNEVKNAEQNSFTFGAATALATKVREDVLAGQISSYLQVELANALNVKISDTNVNNLIQKQKVFYQDGVFNDQKYRQLLKENGFSSDFYAESLRVNAQKKQLINALIATDFTLPIESELSLLKKQTRSGYYAKINTNIVDKDAMNISEQEVIDYYQNNQNRFEKSDRVKIKFIQNNLAVNLETIEKPTNDEVQQEYTKHKQSYTSPKKQQYALIQVSTRTEANRLYNQLVRKKIDKQTLTNTHQLVSLGWFSNNALPNALKKRKISKNRPISRPFHLDDGYAILLLTDIQKPQLLPLNDLLFSKIKAQLSLNRAKVLYDKKNQQLKKLIKDKTLSLEDIAQKTELKTVVTDEWQTTKDFYSLLKIPEIRDVALSELMVKNGAATNHISDLIEINNDVEAFIIQVTDYKSEGLASLDEVRNDIINTLKDQNAKNLFKNEANNILDKLNTNQPVNINFTTKYSVNRDSTDFDKKTVDMIFSLPQPLNRKRTYGINFLSNNSAIITVLTNANNGIDVEDISTVLRPIIFQNEHKALNHYLTTHAEIEFMGNNIN